MFKIFGYKIIKLILDLCYYIDTKLYYLINSSDPKEFMESMDNPISIILFKIYDIFSSLHCKLLDFVISKTKPITKENLKL